ncbi:MAG TPA: alpha/beta hydrolase [Nocardioides sp.]|nr:alpha/beta hydrolase [Nocardioides sp.]
MVPTFADRLNARVEGPSGARPVVFAHGFGCDQTMWRHVAPRFTDDYRTVLFDFVGAGGSDPEAYDPERYATLEGYAADLAGLVEELDLRDAVVVGHSVSSMIAALAHVAVPERITGLVMVAPNPRYINDGGYFGGFSREEIDGMISALAANYEAWAAAIAPTIVGNPNRPELGQELTDVFCRMDPEIALRFARATFLSDTRDVLPRITAPTLVLQCRKDAIAPTSVGAYVAAKVREAKLVMMQASGHTPNLSAPRETAAEIEAFLASLGSLSAA